LEKFPQLKLHINKENKIYTEYNVYTATGRPANRFGGVNFAALNRDNGERSMIKSRFKDGNILMFDYDAYHLILVSKLVGYDFPTDINIHEYLGRQYFDKVELTEEEYSESKSVSFEILYGGIDESVAEAIPFFRKALDFIDELWKKSQDMGYTESILSKRRIYTKDFNKNKLFNYILQNYETERNITVIQKILSKIKSSETKLILYVYDGFVFDMHPDEKLLGDELQFIIEDGGFKTKKFIGKNFHELRKVR
jgi:DNA polymerase I-like protein with 3'-5' exonuclease and polymerase domains